MNANRVNWPSWPNYGEGHLAAVTRVIKSNQLYAANEVLAFEEEFAAYTGAQFAVGIGNATQGLQLALSALGIGTGDEVVVTPYSWISSASCVLMVNAIPVFADIERYSFGICPDALRERLTPRTKAVVLVHMFGLVSMVEEVATICRENNVALIEDCSHGHGARINGRHVGTIGDVGVFSLHQRKAISTGDGGIAITNRPDIFEKIRRLRSFGHEQLSFNYRMTEFSAALGRIGLSNLNAENKLRVENHCILAKGLQKSRLEVVEPRVNVDAVYYSNLIDVRQSSERQKHLIDSANDLGIPLKRTWYPLNRHPHFLRCNMPNGVAPWDFSGNSVDDPSKAILPVSEEYQTRRLLELDCHPLVPQDTVALAAELLAELSSYER